MGHRRNVVLPGVAHANNHSQITLNFQNDVETSFSLAFSRPISNQVYFPPSTATWKRSNARQ
jgi:hypothetical protein